jgi:hypothetical protein
MRWCFLGSHEIPDDARMVMAHGGSHICETCADTPRGKQLLETALERERRLFGGQPNQHASRADTKWARIRQAQRRRNFRPRGQ